MNHKVLGKMADYLERIGVVTLEELKERLRPSVILQSNIHIEHQCSVFVTWHTFIKAIEAGNYDWIHEDINENNFPLLNEEFGDKDVAIFHFNRNISSEDVVIKMDNADCRPATLMELLALGEKYPDLYNEFPIVALGSFMLRHDTYGLVPALWVDPVVGKRSLSVGDWGGEWTAFYRFLAVRKPV